MLKSVESENAEFRLIHTHPYRVKLTYFKGSGKYYSEGEYLTGKDLPYDIFDEAKEMLSRGTRPGLVDTKPGEHEFITLVELPDHPCGYPCIIPLDSYPETQ